MSEAFSLEKTEWIKVNPQCHVFVDENNLILAECLTEYNEEDGDDNFIWDVTIGDDSRGSFVSLYSAKQMVQKMVVLLEHEQSCLEKVKSLKKKIAKNKKTSNRPSATIKVPKKKKALAKKK